MKPKATRNTGMAEYQASEKLDIARLTEFPTPTELESVAHDRIWPFCRFAIFSQTLALAKNPMFLVTKINTGGRVLGARHAISLYFLVPSSPSIVIELNCSKNKR